MRIGVTVPNVHETPAERTTIEAVARMADDLGYDSVWCNDHVRGLVRANLRALGALLDDPALGAEHARRLLPATDDVWARDFYDRYVGPYFKRDGPPDADVVARALQRVAAELEILTGRAIAVPPADEIYRHDLTAAWTP